MLNTLKPLITVAVWAAIAGQIRGQSSQFATLEIEWENYVAYINDSADPGKFATASNMVVPSLRNFMTSVLIADIVSVNGKPAKGSWVSRGQLIMLGPNPTPGQGIGDIGRGAIGDIHMEILQPDGTPIGSIMSTGFQSGDAPPGTPPNTLGLIMNVTVIGGTGAFVGARGIMTVAPFTIRAASITEDPANRRTLGGGRGRWIVYLIPLFRPEIETTAAGPAIFHSDLSQVSVSRPARRGETLIMRTTGLGPTRPSLASGTTFVSSPPWQEVNSPVEVTLNGKAVEVINKIGWPGTLDAYRLDVRVPDEAAPGMAGLQVTTGFIQGQAVSVPVQ